MSKIIISLCAFVILAITPSVRADTVVVTSGSVTLQGAFGGTSYSLAGQNFFISGGGSGGFSSARNCTPCLAGSSLSTFTIVTGNGLGSGPTAASCKNHIGPKLKSGEAARSVGSE